MWRGRPCVVEYVAEDAILISYDTAITRSRRFAIVAPSDIDLYVNGSES